jgi:uncharacterized membrane protein
VPTPPLLDRTVRVHNDTDITPHAPLRSSQERFITMISILLISLVVLWALGIALSYTFGGFIHVLLLVAIVGVVFRMINEQHPLRG